MTELLVGVIVCLCCLLGLQALCHELERRRRHADVIRRLDALQVQLGLFGRILLGAGDREPERWDETAHDPDTTRHVLEQDQEEVGQ